MVSQSLPIRTQGNLRQQGYRLETAFGWDTHEILLYTHKEGTAVPVGEVAIRMRVGNLKHLDRAEAQYLARKGGQGFFMWKPEECLKHEFTPVRFEERPGGGMIQVREPVKVFGCKWCRGASTNNGLQGDAEQIVAPAEESSEQATASAPPATTDEGIACSVEGCGFRVKPVGRSGKVFTTNQQLHQLRLHTRKHA